MTDLNEFFAKIDKKKTKGISLFKFTTINEIEKNLLKMDKKRELEEKKCTDEEWNEFEEKLKDYSGLKIQNTISETDDSEVSDYGNMFDERATSLCPWKVIEKLENNSFQTETVSLKETDTKPTQVEYNVYIPPHLRKKPTKSEPKLNKGQQHNVNKTLKINDEDVFPMLSSSSANMLGSKRKEQDTLS